MRRGACDAARASCPPLDTEEEQRALCGRSIIAAHILDGATGWFMGKVHNFGVGPSWKQPDATHIVVTSLPEGADEEEGARRARGVQAHRRQPRAHGVVAAARPGRIMKLTVRESRVSTRAAVRSGSGRAGFLHVRAAQKFCAPLFSYVSQTACLDS